MKICKAGYTSNKKLVFLTISCPFICKRLPFSLPNLKLPKWSLDLWWPSKCVKSFFCKLKTFFAYFQTMILTKICREAIRVLSIVLWFLNWMVNSVDNRIAYTNRPTFMRFGRWFIFLGARFIYPYVNNKNI